MFFSGTIQLDPNKSTEIQSNKSNDSLTKLYNTINKIEEGVDEEHETFTVIEILDQIQSGLNNMRINNIISLMIDDNNFYKDDFAIKNDLPQAIAKIKKEVGPLEASYFDVIVVSLEHDDTQFKYLVEIQINRRHKVGIYPIKITINGFFIDLHWQDDHSFDDVFDKLDNIFEDQDSYNKYITDKTNHFNRFMQTLIDSLGEYINLDDSVHEIMYNIINPNTDINSFEDIPVNPKAEPLFHGYAGLHHHTFYTYKWYFFYEKNDIEYHDMRVLDEKGDNYVQNLSFDEHEN